MSKLGWIGDIKELELKSGATRWRFQWKQRIQLLSAVGGATEQREKIRTESFESKSAAEAYRSAIVQAHHAGQLFDPATVQAATPLRDVALKYAAAGKRPATRRYRTAVVNRLLRVAAKAAGVGDAALVGADALTMDLLRRYAESLPSEDRAGQETRYRYLLSVEDLWDWAYRGDFVGIPLPRALTDREVHRPQAVAVFDYADWTDMDAVIYVLTERGKVRRDIEWHARVALLLSRTGIRVGEALALRREDIDLERGWLTLRAGVEGAKRTPTRRVPIAPVLIAAIKTWHLPPSGLLFASERAGRKLGPGLRRASDLVEPMAAAWRAAGVEPDRWAADPSGVGRVRDRPLHAFRGGFQCSLEAEGVDEVDVSYLIGHATPSVKRHYRPEVNPDRQPRRAKLAEALLLVKAYAEPPEEKRKKIVVPGKK